MTTTAELLVDAFGRIRDGVHSALAGATPADLAWRPDPGANSTAWLVWHLTRVQDDHVADVAGTEQVWTAGGWADRFGLDRPVGSIGYGDSAADVAGVTVTDVDLLTGYHDAVAEQTTRWVAGLTDADLSRVVDESWDPPVTLAVRLVSVVSDDLQHVGQAGYLAGLLARSR